MIVAEVFQGSVHFSTGQQWLQAAPQESFGQALIGAHFKFTAINEINIWACRFDRQNKLVKEILDCGKFTNCN